MLVDLPKHNMRICHADWDKVVINVQQGPIHVHVCAYLKVVCSPLPELHYSSTRRMLYIVECKT